jgi:pyridoxal phosphate enzyme (YggS family)
MLTSTRMVDIATNVESVRRRIAAAAEEAGRTASDVTLLAVSKRVDQERIEAALDCGIDALGENRVQESEIKIPLISRPAQWHYIGPLQSNKARRAGMLFDVIHSVDRDSLISRLAAAPRRDRNPLSIYVQVSAAALAEPALALETTLSLCLQVEAADALGLAGLMTMAPYDPDPEAARPTFRGLRWLRDRVQEQGDFSARLGLSMGMTGDFEVAIQEGATIVRVGTAIIGPRQPR